MKSKSKLFKLICYIYKRRRKGKYDSMNEMTWMEFYGIRFKRFYLYEKKLKWKWQTEAYCISSDLHLTNNNQ